MSRRGRIIAGLLALAVAALIPVKLDVSLQFDAAMAVIYAFAILSLVVLTGYVGQISLCQATFVGISAFVTSATMVNLHLNFVFAALCGVLASFGLGLVVALPALRLRGILLAIVTIGVALSFQYYVFQDQAFAWLTGGLTGWTVYGTTVLGFHMDGYQDVLHTYWVLLALFALVAVLLVNLHDSGSGRRFRAIRDSETAAATMGVNLTRYKLLAFGLSAAIAGIGGAFVPLAVISVSPGLFTLFYSLQFAAFSVLVGVRFIPAAAIGGALMVFAPALLDRYAHGVSFDVFNFALGVLLIAQLILAPDGLWGNLASHVAYLSGKVTARRSPHKRIAARAAP